MIFVRTGVGLPRIFARSVWLRGGEGGGRVAVQKLYPHGFRVALGRFFRGFHAINANPKYGALQKASPRSLVPEYYSYLSTCIGLRRCYSQTLLPQGQGIEALTLRQHLLTAAFAGGRTSRCTAPVLGTSDLQ